MSLQRHFGFFFSAFFALAAYKAQAQEILTNGARFLNPPKWVSAYKANEAIQHVERKLEWSVRRVDVKWFRTQAELEQAFGRTAPMILAFTRKTGDGTIYMGPQVNAGNFKMVLGHEIAHVIMYQKYKGAIPAWLEEGMANDSAGNVQIDYKWLNKQPRQNVTQMTHPFDAKSNDEVNFKYMASLATVLMLEKKCPSLRELVNLSLKKNIETFIPTYCGIQDLNAALWTWIAQKAKN
jgi:hypothetical protein